MLSPTSKQNLQVVQDSGEKRHWDLATFLVNGILKLFLEVSEKSCRPLKSHITFNESTPKAASTFFRLMHEP